MLFFKAGGKPLCTASRAKLNAKVSVATHIMTKYLKRECLLQTGVEKQTGLHFDAVYVSWISLEDKYYL